MCPILPARATHPLLLGSLTLFSLSRSLRCREDKARKEQRQASKNTGSKRTDHSINDRVSLMSPSSATTWLLILLLLLPLLLLLLWVSSVDGSSSEPDTDVRLFIGLLLPPSLTSCSCSCSCSGSCCCGCGCGCSCCCCCPCSICCCFRWQRGVIAAGPLSRRFLSVATALRADRCRRK